MLTAEIIGPAGAGKSTLSDLLNKSNLPIKAGITIWGLPPLLLARSAITSFMLVTRLLLEEGSGGLDRGKVIVRIQAFNRHLLVEKRFSKQIGNAHFDKHTEALLLDEGIVFALSKLRFKRDIYKDYLDRWEEKTLDTWAGILNLIIWLDAPDEVLIERVRKRNKDHRMKDKPDPEFCDFLARYRKAYMQIIDRLQSRGKLRVLRFDTGEQTLETIAAQIEEIVGKKVGNRIIN